MHLEPQTEGEWPIGCSQLPSVLRELDTILRGIMSRYALYNLILLRTVLDKLKTVFYIFMLINPNLRHIIWLFQKHIFCHLPKTL